MSCAALRTMRSRGGSARACDARAPVTKEPSGLDYDRCHDPYSKSMTTVMIVQAPRAELPGMSEVRVLRPAASDTEAVLAMLRRCSRASLFHRFHGFTDGVAYFGGLLRDRPLDQTLLAWYGSNCIGVATLAVGAAGIFDLGILVEDAWQRRGIGTHLAVSLLDGARARGMTTVHADILADDHFLLHALRQVGSLTVSLECGTTAIDIDLRGPKLLRSPAPE
jgi:hypothetical protein